MDLADRFRAALEAQLAGWGDRAEAHIAEMNRLERYLVLVVCLAAMAYLKVWVWVHRRDPPAAQQRERSEPS